MFEIQKKPLPIEDGIIEIEDTQLRRLREKMDMDVLRRFRNGTFHYQPNFFSPKHNDLIEKHGFGMTRDLDHRQDFIARKMLREA